MKYTLLISLLLYTYIFPSENIFKSVKIDTTKVISTNEFQKIADEFFQQNYALLFQEKFKVDLELKKLEDEKNKLKIAKGLSSTAVVFTGTGESQLIPVVFSSRAAYLFPADTQIVNNFGAVLRMMDDRKTSLKVFLYAKSLCPNSPLILTNLGNSLFELLDDKSAEHFYKKALAINPDYALARHGLVNVYFKRKDLQKALDEMFKGVAGIYSSSLSKAQKNFKYNKSVVPPIEPFKEQSQEQSDQSNTDDSNAGQPNEQLQLPDFPNWTDEASLINDKSISKLQDKINQFVSEASEGLFSQSDALKKMNAEQKQKWYDDLMRRGRILNDKNEFALEMMEKYFEDELKKAGKEYIDKDKAANEKFSKGLEQIDQFLESRGKAINAKAQGSPEGALAAIHDYAELLAERCKRTMNLIKDNFAEWKKNAANRHKKHNDLLTTYWIYCEQYLNNTYSKEDFELLNSKRKLFVFSNYSVLTQIYSTQQLAFAALNMTAFASINGECPDVPPLPPMPPVEMDINSPKKKAPPCPFEGSKFVAGLGACSFGLDCENVELECGEGLIGSAKWNYKKKEMTVFVGAGAKANFGFGKHKELGEFGAKAGLQVTFNKQGQVIDGGFKGEAAAKINAGDYSIGSTYEVTATAATGINDEFTQEYAMKVL